MIAALVLVWFLEWYHPLPGGGYDFYRQGPFLSDDDCVDAQEIVMELGVEQSECVGPEQAPA